MGQSSNSDHFKGVWQQLWHSKVAPGDKVFMWRACLEALPTQSSLYKKKIDDHPLCPICNLEEEIVVHALWRYEAARTCGVNALKKLQKCYLPQLFMLQLVEAITVSMDQCFLQDFMTVAKRIWWRRNHFVFNKEFTHPNSLVREATHILEILREDLLKLSSRALQVCP